VPASVHRARAGARLGFVGLTLAYVAALAGAEVLVWTAHPLAGAICYTVEYLVLVNLTVLSYLRTPEADRAGGGPWRLAVVASVPVLDRLLVLSVAPFQSRAVEVSVFWGLPLLAAVLALGRLPLLAWAGAGRFGHHALRPSGALAILVTSSALGLGAVAALWGRGAGWSVNRWPPIVLITAVLAFCAQEWIYRRVVQPVATDLGGAVFGMLATSALVAFTWVAAVAALGPIRPIMVVVVVLGAFLFGLATVRGRLVGAVVLARGLFTLCMLGISPDDLGKADSIGLFAPISVVLLAAYLLVLLIGAGVVELGRRQPRLWALALFTALVLLLLYVIQPGGEGPAHSLSASTDVSLADQVARTGRILHLGPSLAWPGFFSSTGFWAGATGLASVTMMQSWVALALACINSVAIFSIARTVLDGILGARLRDRAAWLATWIFIIGSWAAQDYFSAQSLSYVLFLGALAATMRHVVQPSPVRGGRAWILQGMVPPSKSRERTMACVVVVVSAIAIAVTHAPTSYALVAVLAVLLLWRRLSPVWLPLAALALPVLWFALGAKTIWGGNMSWIFDSMAAADGSARARLSDRLVLSFGHGSGTGLLIAIMSVTAAGALLGYAMMRRRGTRSWLLPALAASAFALAALDPFNSEAFVRSYLFALPWIAIGGAVALDALVLPGFLRQDVGPLEDRLAGGPAFEVRDLAQRALQEAGKKQ
jgi:hypothetical protein